MICSACLEECEEVTFDNGIGPYEYWGFCGTDVQLCQGSNCCEAEVCEEGVVVCVRNTVHTARKDHLNPSGRVIVRAGQRYRLTVHRGYAVLPDGERRGIKQICKRTIPGEAVAV